MKTLGTILTLLFVNGWVSFASVQAQDKDGKTARPFLAGTFQRNKAVVVDAQGKVEWEFEAPGCFDVWALPNKNFLIASRGKGIMEVTRDKKVVWTFRNRQVFGNDLAAAQVLDIPGVVR